MATQREIEDVFRKYNARLKVTRDIEEMRKIQSEMDREMERLMSENQYFRKRKKYPTNTIKEYQLRELGFVDNVYWKSITSELRLICKPTAGSEVKIQPSYTETQKWYVSVENRDVVQGWSVSGHINTLDELGRMYEYCELKPSWE